MSNSGARFFAGEGLPDAHKARVLGATSVAQHVHLLAEAYGICAVLHTDHANRKLMRSSVGRAVFNSVGIEDHDVGDLPFGDNASVR